jgi:NodT family efflux transporter outer membrane factor (OMF) lipoprotein
MASGCDLAPKYSRPSVATPPAYKEPAAQASADGTVWKPAEPRDTQTRGDWWELFNDQKLDEYESRLDGSNQNIASAAAAFLAARAVVAQSRAGYFPTVGMSPSVTRSHASANTSGVTSNRTFTDYALPFDASWEIDFWGKTRNAVAANVFAAQAGAAELESVRLSAHAELAVDYYELRAQDAFQVLLDSAAAADGESLSLLRTLNKAGVDSDQTVAQAQALFEAARAQAANAGILRAQYEHAIATLLGVSASDFAIPPEPFRPPDPAIPAGIPSDLLERRPDIASAERAVAEANARIGVARAAYFPSLTLGASGGFESFSAANWLTWPSRFCSLGAGAAETLFDAGLRRATVRQYKALYEETVADYRQTVLSAFQQVEDDLASVRISSEDVRAQNAAVDAGRRNVEEAEARYKTGLASDLELLAAETSLYALDQTALSFRIQQVVANVRLIEALGGSWDVSKLPTPREVRR